MTDEEAQKEHDEIQAEIAKEKGIKIEDDESKDDKAEEKVKEEEDEPKDDDKSKKSDEDEKADDDIEEEKDEEEKSEISPVRKPRTLLAKYQETKRLAREEADVKDKKIAELQAIVDAGETAKAMETEIKQYADKYGMPEEQVKDQFTILSKAFGKTKTEANPVLEKATIALQKQEAKEAFDNEFSDLVGEFPETKDVRAKIQAEAYKPENLNKSLYEIYHRNVKPTLVVKKKTGEGGRGGGGRGDNGNSGEPDFAKIAENVKNNVPGALKDLTGEQQDKLFDWMGKQGSRYK